MVSLSCLSFIVANGVFVVVFLLISPTVIVTTIESFRFDSSTCRPNMASAPKSRSTSISTLLSAHQLTTALEYLWEERISNPGLKDDYQYISWLDIADTNTTTTTTSDDDDTISRIPLYPLSDVYLPSNNVNHTLNNVEPQNIQMALDVLSGSSLPPRFCAVLRSIDTGRVAKIGNILRIINSEKQKNNFGGSCDGDGDDDDNDNDDNIARIRLTCQSEGLVEIIQIENGSGWKENRLRRSKEYLWAHVKPIGEYVDDENENDEENEGNCIDKQSWKDVFRTMREDFRIIKLMYQLELGADEFPPGMMLRLGDAIQEFPELDELTNTNALIDTLVESSTPSCILWKFAQEWQSVCMTHKTGIQALLAAERNDGMVAAARKKGGPLMLPIHMEDLDPDSRWIIQQLDKEAQDIHEQSGMDPILDFQVLLGLPTTIQRFEFLAQLVSRERRRLEEIASSPSQRR